MINTFLTAALSLILAAINVSSWKTSLPVVLFGMVGIFLVIGVIILFTYALNKLTSKKKNNDKTDENE